MRRMFFAVTLLLAACGPEAAAPPANQVEPASAEQAAPTPALAGEWTVAAYNGAPLTQIFDMSASFTGQRLDIVSDCVRFGWTFIQDRGLVTFKPSSGASCERGRTKNEDEVERGVGGATIAMFSKDGKEVRLSGSGGTVTLTRR